MTHLECRTPWTPVRGTAKRNSSRPSKRCKVSEDNAQDMSQSRQPEIPPTSPPVPEPDCVPPFDIHHCDQEIQTSIPKCDQDTQTYVSQKEKGVQTSDTVRHPRRVTDFGLGKPGVYADAPTIDWKSIAGPPARVVLPYIPEAGVNTVQIVCSAFFLCLKPHSLLTSLGSGYNLKAC